jgi:hypothetical protein
VSLKVEEKIVVRVAQDGTLEVSHHPALPTLPILPTLPTLPTRPRAHGHNVA